MEMLYENSQILQLYYALKQKNLVYNHNFTYFSNKTSNTPVEYNHPDGWIYIDKGTGGQISLKHEQCRIVKSSDASITMHFRQQLHEFPRWKSVLLGQHVTSQIQLSAETDCTISLKLEDGVTTSQKTLSLSANNQITVNLEIDIADNASSLTFELSCSTPSAVICINYVIANIGNVAIETLPCMVSGIIGERKQYIATANPPAEELSLCETPVALNEHQTRLNSVINYRFGKQGDFSLLPDLRGYFSRAWNNASNIDKNADEREMAGSPNIQGDYVGTVEPDIFKEHKHTLNFAPINILNPTNGSPSNGVNITSTSDTQVTTKGHQETRPINIAELYTIKWA
ncbi:hypothetical protein OE749_16690 [Aestuariibacter sp. AA17]|uniref:Uncharacterized protein n=1 Tax=Fluctibacter corallii TaxID=2984329 RepID=A0ABT3ACD5_9ALTE|nr:hypothetical protein [Aestuariibacter sp. AA17]MCV2886334.1 hypothetical protein [Aestuariibacter sp. AA17]